MTAFSPGFSSGEDAELPAPTATLEPARPRELKRLMRDWRRGRATRNLWEAFGDAYVVLIGALMVGAMVVNIVLKAQKVVSGCSSATCVSSRGLLPWAALAASVAAALAMARLFGPVLASAAEGFWLLDAPIPRARLLAPRLVAAIGGAAAAGAVLGALVTALSGSGGTAIGVWAAATGVGTAAAVAFAAAEQGIDRHRLTHVTGYLFGLIAVAALLAVVGISAGWFSLPVAADLSVQLALVLLGFGLVVLLGSAVLARVRLGRIRRARLLSGGALVSGLQGAFFALDVGLARDIVVERRALEIGHVRPRRGHGVGLAALVWREWQRLLRFPQPLVAVGGTLVVPYASDALGMATLTPVFGALALFAATVPLLGGLRVLTRTGGLARCLPFSVASIKLATVAVPAAIALVWAMVIAPAFAGFGSGAPTRPPTTASLMAIATAAAGLLGAVRWVQAKGPDFGAPMISTQAGALPPGLMTNLFRGFDICLLVTAPMLLGLSPIWSLVIAAIAAFVLLGSFSAEAVRAQQEQQQRRLAAQKKAAAAASASKQRKR